MVTVELGAVVSDSDTLERLARAEAAVARAQKLAEDMRDWCSPRNIAVTYSARILETLDQEDGS